MQAWIDPRVIDNDLIAPHWWNRKVLEESNLFCDLTAMGRKNPRDKRAATTAFPSCAKASLKSLIANIPLSRQVQTRSQP